MIDTVSFAATLLGGHKADAVEVSFDPAARWAVTTQPLWHGRRGFAVRATLDGTAFDSAIVSRAKRFWLLVPEDVSSAAGCRTGDVVTVTIRPQDGPAG